MLSAPEAVGHAQSDRPWAAHRDRLVPESIIREELAAGVGQILCVSLYAPRILFRTERSRVSGKGRKVVGDGFVLHVERQPIRGRERVRLMHDTKLSERTIGVKGELIASADVVLERGSAGERAADRTCRIGQRFTGGGIDQALIF